MLEVKNGWIPVTKTECKPITVKRKLHGMGAVDMQINYLDWLNRYKEQLESEGIQCRIETIGTATCKYYRLLAWFDDYLVSDGEQLRFKSVN